MNERGRFNPEEMGGDWNNGNDNGDDNNNGNNDNEDKDRKKISRRDLLLAGVGTAATVAAAVGLKYYGNEKDRKQNGSQGEAKHKTDRKTPETDLEHVANKSSDLYAGLSEELKQYLSNPDFGKIFKRGEMSKTERQERTKLLSGEVKILEDIGLKFYHVQGESSRQEIISKLIKSNPKEFGYLGNAKEKIESFNIPAKSLQGDMWIPIPVKKEHRKIADMPFTKFANKSIRDIQTDPEYGKVVTELMKLIPEDKLAAAMTAVAKQESGGDQGIGTYELHRYEHSHRCFSYSHFHILMEGPGLEARRNLNMTEGQTYHPSNSCRLFFAFLTEKTKEMLKDRAKRQGRTGALISEQEIAKELATKLNFDDQNSVEAFASFYNGSTWRKTNPQYMNVKKYYQKILDNLSRSEKK